MEEGDKAYGFGSYEGHEEAQKALDAMNAKAKELNGSRVMYGPRASKAAAEGEAVAELERQFEMLKQERKNKYLGVNLYVKNLDECIDDDRLRAEFSPYGAIASAKVMVNRGGESKGCGFVCFSTPDEAIKAMTEMDGRVVGSKPMYVALAQLKAERNLQHLASHLNKHGFYAGGGGGGGHRRTEGETELNGEYEAPRQDGKNRFQGVNLYVKNLDGGIDDERLRGEFSPYGNITSAKVMVNKTGESKGCGFVCFSTPDEAVRAMSEMDGRIVGSKPMYVTLAQLKGERRAQQLAAQLGERAYDSSGAARRWAPPDAEPGARDAPGRHRGKSRFQGVNLYVNNLDPGVNDERLWREFSPFGTITSAKVMVNRSGESKGFGFVCFSSHDEASRAMAEMDGRALGSRRLNVAPAQLRTERGLHPPSRLNWRAPCAGHFRKSAEEPELELERRFEALKQERRNKFRGVNLYVKNLDDGIDDERLRGEFAAYGNITSSKVMVNRSGESKGCGFVCFSTVEEATRAMTEMDGRIIGSKPLYVTLAQLKADRSLQRLAPHLNGHELYAGSGGGHRRTECDAELDGEYEAPRQDGKNRFQGVNLYVKNLDGGIDDERLRGEFSPYGNITSAKVMVNKTGESKGCGFVCFSTPDEAVKAMSEMDGRIVGSKPMYVTLAQHKAERRAEPPAAAAAAPAQQYVHHVGGVRVVAPGAAIIGQYQPATTSGYFMTTLSQAQARAPFYPPSQMVPVRSNPWWLLPVQPQGAHAHPAHAHGHAGFQTMPGPIRQPSPGAAVMHQVNAADVPQGMDAAHVLSQGMMARPSFSNQLAGLQVPGYKYARGMQNL